MLKLKAPLFAKLANCIKESDIVDDLVKFVVVLVSVEVALCFLFADVVSSLPIILSTDESRIAVALLPTRSAKPNWPPVKFLICSGSFSQFSLNAF